jgi:hypothetical protein
MTREPRIRRVLGAFGLLLAVGLLVVIAAGAEPFEPDSYRPGQDARAYWSVSMDDPYVPGSVGEESAYLYSPAFLQVLAPLRALPWTVFLVSWTVLLLAVLFWLSGPLLFAPLIVLTFPELWGGNITILLAAGLVLGFRRPGSWALALLTKVTPGIGLLWFGVRREWRALLEAVAVTGAIVAVSVALAPDQWADWFRLLASSTGSSTVAGSVPLPLVLRLPVAAVVIAYAARTDRRWLLPVGVLLAMPVIWWGSFAMLAGLVALRRTEIEAWLMTRITAITARRQPPTAAGSTVAAR